MEKTSDLIWQDKQHQVLFELIDDLESGNNDPAIFSRLTDYAENHFVLEEEYMRQLDFPGMEAHVRAHDRFRSELQSMMDQCHSYDAQFRETLAEFLRQWLRGHIFGIDKHLEEFILNSGAR